MFLIPDPSKRRQEAVPVLLHHRFEKSRETIPDQPGCRRRQVEVSNSRRRIHATFK